MRRASRATMRPVLALLAAAFSLPSAREARAQSGPFPPPEARPLPPALREVDIEEHLGMPLPSGLTFTDETGAPYPLARLAEGGRPIVLVMAYYHCPMLCDLVLQGAVDALRRNSFKIGKQFSAVTISFDPRDRPHHAAAKKVSVLHALGQPDADWPFLVGDQANIDRVTTALGYRVTFDAATDQYAHPAVIMILTPDGRISRYLYGVAYPDRDLRFALIEASGGRIGTITDRIIMSCYRYDPATRRYGVYITGFLRIGSALVLAVLAALVITLLRRERRHERTEERTEP